MSLRRRGSIPCAVATETSFRQSLGGIDEIEPSLGIKQGGGNGKKGVQIEKGFVTGQVPGMLGTLASAISLYVWRI